VGAGRGGGTAADPRPPSARSLRPRPPRVWVCVRVHAVSCARGRRDACVCVDAGAWAWASAGHRAVRVSKCERAGDPGGPGVG
jgi:hypothetical protein